MAGVLAEWLEEEIHMQLVLARSWQQNKVAPSQTVPGSDCDSDYGRLYVDNGSSVHIFDERLSGQNSTLQIIKTSPLIRTDGTVFIEAKLTPQCRRDFSTRYRGRDISSPNALIAVRKYTIQFTAYGPPRDQLSFLLEVIDWQASRHHHTLDLRNVRLEEDCRCFLWDSGVKEEAMTPRHDRRDNAGFGQGSSPSTQMAFGTQLAQPARALLDHNAHVPAVHQPEPGNDGSLRRDEPQATLTRSDLTKQAALLDLLNRSKLPHAGASPAHPTVAPAAPPASTESTTVPNPSPLPRNLSPHLRAPLDEPHAIPPLVNRSGMDPMTPDRRRSKQREVAEPANDPPSACLHSPFDLPCMESDGDDLGDPEPPWLQGVRPTRTSAKVSSRQRSILSKPECWQKPQPGLRFPDANIPIEILEALKEHAAMSATDDAGPIVSSMSHDEGIPVIEGEAEGDAEPATDLPTSEVSWSRSPSPVPPKPHFRADMGLPPDSSFAEEMTERGVPSLQSPAQRRQQTSLKSLNEQMDADPPSSPPLAQTADESDEEMELDVPRGLGEDRDQTQAFVPKTSRPESIVQVKETPYTKVKGAISILSGTDPRAGQQQMSSETSKDTSSTYIIYGTYNEPKSSAGAPAAKGQPVEAQPTVVVSASTAVGIDLSHASRIAETNPGKYAAESTPFSSADIPDISMEDVATNPPQNRSPSVPRRIDSETKEEDQTIHRLRPRFSSENITQPEKKQVIESRAKASAGAFTKRKLSESPSKNNHRSKRREIKIVNLGSSPPMQDTAAKVRQMRAESLERFKAKKRHGGENSSAVDTTRDTLFSSIERGFEGTSMHHGSKASDELEQRQFPIEMDVDVPPEETQHGYAEGETGRQRSRSAAQVPPAVPAASPSLGGEAVFEEPGQSSLQPQEPATVFQKFKAAYPVYSGNTQHFIGQCKEVYRLDLEDKMVPKWQWDDFIIRNRSDYKTYCLQCIDRGENPEKYFRFYKDKIRDTLYRAGVIDSRTTLVTALEELGETSAELGMGLATPEVKPSIAPGSRKETPKHIRRSLPWEPSSKHRQGETLAERSKAPGRSLPKSSLPAAVPKPVPKDASASDSRRASTTRPSHQSSGSAFSRDGASSSSRPPRIPTEPTGDEYRDFVFGFQRVTSLTGSTARDPDPQKKWPLNLADRPVAQTPRKVYDVLTWKDEL